MADTQRNSLIRFPARLRAYQIRHLSLSKIIPCEMTDSGPRQAAGRLSSPIAAHSFITVRAVHHLTSLYMHDQYFSSTTILHGFFAVNHPISASDKFFTILTFLFHRVYFYGKQKPRKFFTPPGFLHLIFYETPFTVQL